jgi:hypothetical protein
MANESTCPGPDCARPGNYCRGLCLKHYVAWRKACIENGSLVELPHRMIKHWEYEGKEQALIEINEQQEREKDK